MLGASVAFLGAMLLLGSFPAAGASGFPRRASGFQILEIYQSVRVTEHQGLTVSMKLSNSTGIVAVFYTFCQLSSPECYEPAIAMTSTGNDWYVGSTMPMANYAGMKVGVKAGYNISVVFQNGSNASAPFLPNPFSNLTVAQSVTGENLFEMQVSPLVFDLRGTVTDSATGRALAGARVTLSPNATTATTDSAGDYAFQNLTNGTYTLAVADGGYRSASESVTISGQNTTEDVPLSNATQTVGSNSTAKATFFGTSEGRAVLIATPIIVAAAALIAWTLSRRRRTGGAPAAAPPPSPPSPPG